MLFHMVVLTRFCTDGGVFRTAEEGYHRTTQAGATGADASDRDRAAESRDRVVDTEAVAAHTTVRDRACEGWKGGSGWVGDTDTATSGSDGNGSG